MTKYFIALAALIIFTTVVACDSSDHRGEDGQSDSDADSDTDADTDSDSDTDTEYEGPPIPETCVQAAQALTSVGCEFFVADMDNWDDATGMSEDADPLNYSVVVSNPQQSQDSNVTLENGLGVQLITLTLGPGDLHVIDVACDSGLCLEPASQVNIQGIGLGTGYRLTSDVPITAYQWNPYGAEIFTTDASLLIPITSLTGTYIVASWPTGVDGNVNMSQVMVVATADGTEVTVRPSTDITAYGGVGPFTAGVDSSGIMLDAGDVLTLRSESTGSDLTGTVISATATLSVFGGNSCANVPDTMTCCCDHVEEQLLPLEAWGTSTVLARPAPRATCTEAQDTVLWRVIAGSDGMTISFDPPAPAPYGASYHFAQQGEMIEFQSPGNHYLVGVLDNPPNQEEPGAPFLAYQMMNGALFASCGPTGDEGDPMMLLSPPAGQYLDRYVFNTDAVFDFSYDQIIIVRQAGVDVDLDCTGVLPASLFSAVGSSGLEVGQFFIDDPASTNGCVDGAHSITSAQPFGLSVVGSAYCQSYGYLGGVGVRSINPNPIIE
jgi:hypothetical protein